MTNRLFVKIIVPIVVLMMVLGASLYFVVIRTVHDFAGQNIEDDLGDLSRQLFDVVDRGLMELVESGKVDDQVALRIKQVDCLDILERYSFSLHFKLIVSTNQDRTLLLTSDFSGPLKAGEILQRYQGQKDDGSLLQIADDEFHVRQFYFAPWDWNFLVMKDRHTYAALTLKVQQVYQTSAVLLLVGTILLVIYLLRSIRMPIASIISSVSQGKAPDYRGTYEFEFLSQAISEMMRSLQNSEERNRIILDNAPVGMALVTKGGWIKELNKAACGISGYSREEISGVNVVEMYENPEERKEILAETSRQTVARTKVNWKRKDGTPYVGFFTTVDLKINDEPLTLVMFEDITQLQEAEQEKASMEVKLRRAQKMEAIGMMAGGVAHDLNNILSGIVSYPNLMLLDLPEDSPLRRPIKMIEESGMRASSVVADLLTVARGVASVKKIINLNTLVGDYLQSAELQQPLLRRPGLTVTTAFSADLLNVRCSTVHLQKCLLNLIMNAMEAIGAKGIINVKTVNTYVDKAIKGYEDVLQGEYVVLSISDNGSGISTQDREHIFEPFYSKKVMGRSGTGLGLAVVWNTMQDHNGYIDVVSSTAGTRFDLYFPASRERLEHQEEELLPAEISGKGQTILVIDDEEHQRYIACGILARLGYQPHAEAGGEEAVIYLQEHAVDLVLLDMIMAPGMNGRQTYEQILALHPGQKAVIASGFSATDEVKKAQSLGAGSFLKKPYTLVQLGQAVQQELRR